MQCIYTFCLGMCLGRSWSQFCPLLSRYTCDPGRQRWLPLSLPLATLSVVHRPRALSASPRNFLQVQNLIPHPRPVCFDEIPSESYEKCCHRRISIIYSFLYFPLAETLKLAGCQLLIRKNCFTCPHVEA